MKYFCGQGEPESFLSFEDMKGKEGQHHSGWKRPWEVSRPTSCPRQRQTRFLRASSKHGLVTFWDRAGKRPLGNAFQHLTTVMLEKFLPVCTLTFSCFSPLLLVLVSCTMDMSLTQSSREQCNTAACSPKVFFPPGQTSPALLASFHIPSAPALTTMVPFH